MDGGARRSDVKASIGCFALRSTAREPFTDMRVTTPDDRAGETVFEHKYLLEVPYRNEVDNMEAELTALAMLLLNVVERGHYDVNVYTNCAELITYMRPRSALPERPVLRRLVARCRTLIRHAHAHGGKVVLRHVRQGWNKRADVLCNQAMNDTTTPTLTAQQCFRT
jgi:ribonuclease HI